MNIGFKTQRKILPFIFLLPALVFFIVFQIYPLIKGLQMSFYNWELLPGKTSQFIGLQNYINAFTDPIFLRASKNTLYYALVTVPGQMILAMIAAVLLNALPRGRGFSVFCTISRSLLLG